MLRIILLGICLLPSAARTQPEVKVWAVVSGSQKHYHCPQSKWYGVGAGREISECEAIGRVISLSLETAVALAVQGISQS